jgi:hypothetical protein
LAKIAAHLSRNLWYRLNTEQGRSGKTPISVGYVAFTWMTR